MLRDSRHNRAKHTIRNGVLGGSAARHVSATTVISERWTVEGEVEELAT
ncbi:hypothetical protein ACWC24_36220 [Streptomyces sp. NPDC001443]